MSGNGVQWDVSGAHSDLDDAVTGEGVAPFFQPIVSLPSGTVVGFEALARWPRQPQLGPQEVFAYAAATRQVTELDRVCIDRAIDAALRGGLSKGAFLGVNSEPASDYTGRADSEIVQRGHDEFALIYELTERNLLGHLPTLLRKVAALRADGIAIALDDVGDNPESLALLDIVSPEVIKLANKLIQDPPNADTAKTSAAIMAHRERRATLIVAEGIETDEHVEQALAWGATLGQGFLFGKPSPLPLHATTGAWSPPTVRPGVLTSFDTPFDVVADDPSMRTARKPTLMTISRHLEEQARHREDTPMVLTALQDGVHFGLPTRRRYEALAATSPLVAVFGTNIAPNHPVGVRVVTLDATDTLGSQWVVVTLGPHTAAALVARERRGQVPTADDDREFDFVVTHDRTVVTAVASALLNRVR
ncbi:EAL domain-containing protein [Mycobacterium hodleri]|uniref:sensor domain-containing phosphodiesterase n=1 Tax=Mycolicibacterium hodleri TaxID=49897 RepID=UPI0021F3A49F|nr:EAL domain-containing protein [Mycolicibacterium hodleri]MCV7131658.1 EAL domain-containing protein [Mycolicibacterium hodleri]